MKNSSVVHNKRVPLAEFIKAKSVQITCARTERNPHMVDSDNMDHWKCQLKVGNSRMTLYFSKGFGHHGLNPTVEEVLSCLASDAAGIENSKDFEDWCSEYGYAQGPVGKKVHKQCLRQSEKLRKLLGESTYEELLWNTDME